jgi:hypothetical protein
MRPSSDLERLRRSCLGRVRALQALMGSYVEGGKAHADQPRADRVTAHVAIEALNLWSEFARSFYLSCVTNARTRSGNRVKLNTAPFPTHEQAITFAINHLSPAKKKKTPPWSRLDEPRWRLPGVLVDLDVALGFSNTANISAGLSYPSKALSILPIFRNFFAHRNESTVGEVLVVALAVGGTSSMRPEQMLQGTPFGPKSVLGEWLADLEAMTTLMCA